MKPCPFCGVMLTASLVAAIRDDNQPESCPSKPAPSGIVDGLLPSQRRMLAYALLGSMVTQ